MQKWCEYPIKRKIQQDELAGKEFTGLKVGTSAKKQILLKAEMNRHGECPHYKRK